MINKIQYKGGDNIDFKDYIKLIQEQSEKLGYWQGNRLVWEYKNIHIWFWDDKGEYLNRLQYRFSDEICWTWSNPEEFYNKFIENELKFEIYSSRFYGEPKLSKPKELKGVKQAFSVDYDPKKCRCQCFIKDNDLWVKHRDYFSESLHVKGDEGTPLSYRSKKYLGKQKGRDKGFGYPDTWGDIVLRNESWIRINNLIPEIESGKFILDIINDIREQQEMYHRFKKNDLVSTDMERFWECVVKETKKYLEEVIE